MQWCSWHTQSGHHNTVGGGTLPVLTALVVCDIVNQQSVDRRLWQMLVIVYARCGKQGQWRRNRARGGARGSYCVLGSWSCFQVVLFRYPPVRLLAAAAAGRCGVMGIISPPTSPSARANTPHPLLPCASAKLMYGLLPRCPGALISFCFLSGEQWRTGWGGGAGACVPVWAWQQQQEVRCLLTITL
jgi:hypothetical protein